MFLKRKKKCVPIIQVIINGYLIAVGVGDVVECAASLITRVRLVSPIGGATGGSGNLSTILGTTNTRHIPFFITISVRCPDFNLSNVARLPAHPKFVWVFHANCDGTIIYNDPVLDRLFVQLQ
jgi:hypothetical protein